jgi:hypothetical protein
VNTVVGVHIKEIKTEGKIHSQPGKIVCGNIFHFRHKNSIYVEPIIKLKAKDCMYTVCSNFLVTLLFSKEHLTGISQNMSRKQLCRKMFGVPVPSEK